MHEDEVIDALAVLKPKPPNVNAMAAAFEAGRREGRRAGSRSAMGWRLASIGLTGALLVTVISPLRSPQPASRERTSHDGDNVLLAATSPRASSTPEIADAPAAFLLTRTAIEHGVDALPRPRVKPAPSTSAPDHDPTPAFHGGEL